MTSAPKVTPPKRTVRQIVPSDGGPPQASVTSNVWVATPNVFSRPEEGNAIHAFTTGQAYFFDLIGALDGAQTEAFIAGWQINWDALLAEGVRLYDVIYRNAKRGVKFYLMPWKHSDPVQTYDRALGIVFASMNERLRSELSIREDRIFVLHAASLASLNGGYFSHHQKQVIVDRRIGYVGGIDLAYGRFDDATYELDSRAKGRRVLNCYNGCIEPVGEVAAQDAVDPDQLQGGYDRLTGHLAAARESIENGGWQVPYVENSPVTGGSGLNGEKDAPSNKGLAAAQPRMPWQDVHCRIEGPAVANLLRNFVQRWNVVADKERKPALRLALPGAPKTFEKKGKAAIQVLRSAPAAMVAAEAKSNRAAGAGIGVGTQDDIHHAMVELIKKSRRFVYIENQFFVSDFGALGQADTGALSEAAQAIKDGKIGGDSVGDKTLWLVRKVDHEQNHLQLPRNLVCRALIERIQTAVLDVKRPKFHVYITLPVHPEGKLGNPTIAAQIYYTMQTISHGTRSLLNGVRRALKALELRDQGDTNYMRAVTDDTFRDFGTIADEDCFEYVTLLNLRNWSINKDGHYLTEQIYGHTKLMIVDDLYALLGSANINDRSLLGERDSEIAVLVVDNDQGRADLNGAGSERPVRTFAHQLRKDVWKKIFGLTGNVRPATHLQAAIDQPGKPESWKAIQQQAQANTALYQNAFWFIPRNSQRQNADLPASIVPSWNSETHSHSPLLPCEAPFWKAPQFTPAAAQLIGIKGFITAVPVHWLQRENVKIEYPTGLIVENESPKPGVDDGEKVQVADVEVSGTVRRST